jgi:hypothetical protein
MDWSSLLRLNDVQPTPLFLKILNSSLHSAIQGSVEIATESF